MNSNEKVVVITGASQGIGAALVSAYRQRGFRVVANSRTIATSNDPDVVAVTGDVGEQGTAQRVISAAIERFDGTVLRAVKEAEQAITVLRFFLSTR